MPTLPPSTVERGQWDVVIADCEGCFSTLLTSLDAPTFLNNTRAIVLENDDTDLMRQRLMNVQLKALGFVQQVCVKHPWEKGEDALRHGCFYSLLARDARVGKATAAVPPTRHRPTLTFERQLFANGTKEEIHLFFARVGEGVRAMP